MLDAVKKLIATIEKKQHGLVPSVPKVCAEALKLVTFISACRKKEVKVLEVGTGYGYSALWILQGILEAGVEGIIYTIEINKERANIAAKFIREFGLDKHIKVMHGDAIKLIPIIKEEFDVVFLDGAKREYYTYLKLVYPKLKKGGALLAHNVIGFKHIMKDFLDEIGKKDKWVTTIYAADPEGLSISIKI